MILQLTLYLTLHKKTIENSSSEVHTRKINLLAPNNGNTWTKESPLKTLTCSKSNNAVLAPSTLQEPASNYTHQSNLSQLDGCATASFNTEHDQHVENDLPSVNEHVFEIQFTTENPHEIPSSPNVLDTDLLEIPIPIEMSNTENPDIYELQNLVAQEFPQLSESNNENDEIPLDYFSIEEDQQPPQFRNSATFEPNYFDNNLITYPIVQYLTDQILASDEDMEWKVSSPDDIPLQGPFTINPSLKVEMTKTKKKTNLKDLFF